VRCPWSQSLEMGRNINIRLALPLTGGYLNHAILPSLLRKSLDDQHISNLLDFDV
jgi:hypothetical protein